MDVILHEELIALLMNANVVYQLHIYLLVLHIHEIFRSCGAVAAFLIVKRRMPYDTAVKSVQAGRGGSMLSLISPFSGFCEKWSPQPSTRGLILNRSWEPHNQINGNGL